MNQDELLLTTCGLLAAGTRTALFSRWRTGGASSIELTREFVRELSRQPAAAAWQRSVALTRSADIDASLEPRIKLSETDVSLQGDHPFFWAGYLLIDAGSAPDIP